MQHFCDQLLIQNLYKATLQLVRHGPIDLGMWIKNLDKFLAVVRGENFTSNCSSALDKLCWCDSACVRLLRFGPPRSAPPDGVPATRLPAMVPPARDAPAPQVANLVKMSKYDIGSSLLSDRGACRNFAETFCKDVFKKDAGRKELELLGQSSGARVASGSSAMFRGGGAHAT